MRKTVFTLMAICSIYAALAQTDSSQMYFKVPTIPAFNLLKVPDSSSFTNNQLQKNIPTVVIFFAPDCDHCQEATKNLTAKMEQLKNVQIVMVAGMEYGIVKKFYNDYKLADYPNITVTRDPLFKLPQYYKVHTIPDVYVYDKKGKYLQHFKSVIPVELIAELF
jgi:thiol-disulfide isomerase/thioredoxin